MHWFFQLNSTQPVAHAAGIPAPVCLAGMALASVKFRGIGSGTAGVLFAATDATQIRRGDRFTVVGTRAGLDHLECVVGQRTDEDPRRPVAGACPLQLGH